VTAGGQAESFAPLEAIAGVSARFLGRFTGVEVAVEREEAMARLLPLQKELLERQDLGGFPLATAEQVHGARVAHVYGTQSAGDTTLPGVDGLVTMTRGITLGISVADCAPVWLVARDGSAGALLHSGKKGTEKGIVPEGIKELCQEANLRPSDLVMVIGPCIRPPCYEVDFAATIRRQGAEAGVMEIHDEGICTACHPSRYYSYRREKGLTGRMLATLTLLP
jgi:copper oxidase (laccase) domain-containing protein